MSMVIKVQSRLIGVITYNEWGLPHVKVTDFGAKHGVSVEDVLMMVGRFVAQVVKPHDMYTSEGSWEGVAAIESGYTTYYNPEIALHKQRVHVGCLDGIPYTSVANAEVVLITGNYEGVRRTEVYYESD